ncbi:MAG: hypothetical protein ACK42C_00065 [Aquificaceae bacterium]
MNNKVFFIYNVLWIALWSFLYYDVYAKWSIRQEPILPTYDIRYWIFFLYTGTFASLLLVFDYSRFVRATIFYVFICPLLAIIPAFIAGIIGGGK